MATDASQLGSINLSTIGKGLGPRSADGGWGVHPIDADIGGFDGPDGHVVRVGAEQIGIAKPSTWLVPSS